MEGEERHDVGSAPARSSTLLTLTAESPTAAKTALAAARSFDKTIPTTTTATSTPLLSAAASVPSMSPLPGPSKEGSQRAGNLLYSIAQGLHSLVDRSSLHASAERQPLSREGSRHGPGSREGSVRRGLGLGRPRQILPGDVVEGDSAAATPEPAATNPFFPPLGLGHEGEEQDEEEEVDGDRLFLRELERLRARSEPVAVDAVTASPPPPALLPPPPLPPTPPRQQLGAPRPVFYDFLVAGGSSPAPRWGHAAAACGADALVVVGGVGAAVFEDVHVFDAISGSWHEVRTTGPPMQRQRQSQQQQGLQRAGSNNSSSSCGDTPSSSSNFSSLSPSSSSSSRPLNFATRAAPLTASSAASAALFARRDAGPGPSFGAAAAEWPSGSGRIFVFGGRQGRGFLRSSHELDVGRGAWRMLRADAVADPRTAAAAAAAAAEAERLLAAHAASPSASPARSKRSGRGGVGVGPPAVAGATLTSVGDHGLVLYGGAGKKVSGEVWLLRPRSLHPPGGEGTAAAAAVGGSSSGRGRGRGGRDDCSLYPPYSNDTWIKLDISPDPVEGTPRPRHGHAAFLGPCGADSVVFFGGAASDGGALNDTWLLDLRNRTWRRPRHPIGSCPPPRARFSHCAALMSTAEAETTGGSGSGPGRGVAAALVFGGCTPEGVFLNDAHVLDLSSWSWSPAVAPAGPPPPPPRYGASATAVGGRLLLYGGSDARQPFGGIVSVVTDFGSDLNAVAGDLLVSSSPSATAVQHRPSASASAALTAAGAATAVPPPPPSSALPPSPALSLAPLSPSFATPVAAPPPLPAPSPPPPATGGSMRSRLADALGRRSAQATAAAAARKAAVAEGLFRAERERADSLAAELAAARLLLGEERAALEEEARKAASVLSASARKEAEAARRAAAVAESSKREAELRAEEAERRAEEADRRADEAEAREQHSVSASSDRDREASLVASLRARLAAAEAGRAAAAREAVAARAAADSARQGAARARAEAVSEATAQGAASLALMEAEVSRLQAHSRALETALEGARKAALVAAAAGGAGAGGASSSPCPSSSAATIASLELQLSRYRGEPATLASLSPEELRSLEDELVKSARAASAAAREADAASAAALRAALADREARLSSLARSSLSASGAGAGAAGAPPPLHASSSTTECGICLEKEVEVSLDCGHLLCGGCGEKQRAQKGRCPFCDAVVTKAGTRRVFAG